MEPENPVKMCWQLESILLISPKHCQAGCQLEFTTRTTRAPGDPIRIDNLIFHARKQHDQRYTQHPTPLKNPGLLSLWRISWTLGDKHTWMAHGILISNNPLSIWVQVRAPACHLAISPKAIPEGNWRFRGQNQRPNSWGRSPALLARVGRVSTNTGRFQVGCSRCWQRQACLR